MLNRKELTEIKACLFDLDGVIVDTAHFHFLAWKKLANTLNISLTEDFNEKLKGVSRMDSLELILKQTSLQFSVDEKAKMAELKNDWYLELISQLGPQDALPGVLPFLEELHRNGIQCAIGSSSKNAKPILEAMQLTHRFEAIIDGNDLMHAKPNPEVFLKAAAALNQPSFSCVVFEDAIAGVQAAKAADMYCVGLGNEHTLVGADLVIPTLEGFHFRHLVGAHQMIRN